MSIRRNPQPVPVSASSDIIGFSPSVVPTYVCAPPQQYVQPLQICAQPQQHMQPQAVSSSTTVSTPSSDSTTLVSSNRDAQKYMMRARDSGPVALGLRRADPAIPGMDTAKLGVVGWIYATVEKNQKFKAAGNDLYDIHESMDIIMPAKIKNITMSLLGHAANITFKNHESLEKELMKLSDATEKGEMGNTVKTLLPKLKELDEEMKPIKILWETLKQTSKGFKLVIESETPGVDTSTYSDVIYEHYSSIVSKLTAYEVKCTEFAALLTEKAAEHKFSADKDYSSLIQRLKQTHETDAEYQVRKEAKRKKKELEEAVLKVLNDRGRGKQGKQQQNNKRQNNNQQKKQQGSQQQKGNGNRGNQNNNNGGNGRNNNNGGKGQNNKKGGNGQNNNNGGNNYRRRRGRGYNSEMIPSGGNNRVGILGREESTTEYCQCHLNNHDDSHSTSSGSSDDEEHAQIRSVGHRNRF
jgi:hypothetical protein